MAAASQLFLLASDAEDPEDFNICVSTLVWSLTWGPATVVSSLAKSAVETVVAAKGINPAFQCSFDTEWDPLKFENAIVEHTIMDNGELQSYAKEYSIQFKGIDLTNYSTEQDIETCSERLRNAMFRGYEGTLIVVAPSAAISICIKQLGMEDDKCPVLTTWNIDYAQKIVQAAWVVKTLQDLKNYLQKDGQLREVKRPEHNFIPPEVLNPPLEVPQQPRDVPLPVSEGLLRVAAEVKERLQPIGALPISGKVDPLEDTLLTLTAAFGALHSQFTTMTARHEQERKETEAVRAAKDQEIEQMRKELTDSRGESAKQLETVRAQYNSQLEKLTHTVENQARGTEGRCAQLQQQLEDLLKEVAELKAVAAQSRVEKPVKPLEKPVEIQPVQHEGQLKHQEQLPASPQAEEGKEPAAKPVGDGPPLQVVEISRKPDGKLTATVLNRSSNEIWGYLCVLQQGEYKVYSPQPLSFVGQSNIDMSDWAQIPPGQYEAIIVNIQNAPESSPFPFTLADAQVKNPPQSSQDTGDAYSQCFVCLNLSNIRQLEEYIHTNQGEAALTTFKKLASEWGNPMHDQVYNFVQVFIAEPFVDEAAVRQRLEANGFQLRQT